jgi:hypothetical protein
MFVQHLVRVATTFNQLMQILFGVSIPIAQTGAEASGASDGMDELADSTGKAGKAAKGALAAFDQLNVLQQEDKGAGTSTIPALGSPIIPEIDYEKTRGIAQDFFDWLKLGWDGLMQGIKFGDWDAFILWMYDIWTSLMSWLDAYVIGPIKIWWEQTLLKIQMAWDRFIVWLQFKLLLIEEYFLGLRDSIKLAFYNAKVDAEFAWLDIVTWFQDTVITPLKTKFQTGLDDIKAIFKTTFESIKTTAKTQINLIITFLNTLIAAMASSVNSIIAGMNSIKITIPKWVSMLVPGLGGSVWSMNLASVKTPAPIPLLANGAVIPPNSRFAAVLGDQTRGNNIEAPEGLIRQIISEEIGNIKADINISFDGSIGALIRELKPRIDRENIRVGGSLVEGSNNL